MEAASPPPVLSVRGQILNVALLSFAFLLHTVSAYFQALSTTVTAAELLAERDQAPGLASLPFSLLFGVAALMPPVIAGLAQRFGSYRVPFVAAATVGVLGGGLAAVAVYTRSFAALTVASTVLGVPNTAGNFFRFAAATLVPAHHMSRAISAVLLSGLLASLAGAPIADAIRDALPAYPYLPVYLAITTLYVVMAVLMLVIHFAPVRAAPPAAVAPQTATASINGDTSRPLNDNDDDDGDGHEEDDDGDHAAGRGPASTARLLQVPGANKFVAATGPGAEPPPSVRQILTSPETLACMSGAAVPYLVMTTAMSIVPIVTAERFVENFNLTSNVMALHSMSMFLPFFVTGFLLEWLSAPIMVLCGTTIVLTSVLVMLLADPTQTWPYFFGMALVGIGWSLAFIAATTELTRLYPVHHRPKVQAINDVVVFGSVAVGTALAALIYYRIGWNGILYVSLAISTVGLVISIAAVIQGQRRIVLKP